MGKREKKKRKQPADVITGHDEKAERESPDRRMFDRETDMPDGASGKYT